MKGLNILFLSFHLCGIASVSISKVGKLKRSPFHTTCRGLIYDIILSLFFLLVFIGNIYQQPKEEKPPEQMYTVASLNNFLIKTSFAVSFLILGSFTKNRKMAVKILNKVFVIHQSLVRFDPNYLDKGLVRQQINVFVFIIVLYTINVIICVTFEIGPLFELFSVCLPIGLINAVSVKHACATIYFKTTFKLINHELKKLNQSSTNLSFLKNNNLWLKNLKFSLLRECFLRSMEVNKDITKFFALPMLGCTGQIFCYVVIDTYYLVRPLVSETNLLYLRRDFIALMWLFGNAFFLVIVTSNVTKTVQEVRFTYIQYTNLFSL